MSNKCMRKKHLAIRNMKFKTTLRFYLTESEQESPIKEDPANVGYESWEKNCLGTVGGMVNSFTIYVSQYSDSLKN